MKIKILFVFLSLLFCLVGCTKSDKSDFKADLKTMQQKPVELLLDSMFCMAFDYNKVEPVNSFDFKFVAFIDSTECVSCVYKDILEWDDFYNQAKSKNERFTMFFIFSPTKENEGFLDVSLRGARLRNQMYIDTLNVFSRSNPAIPDDNAFHTFLLDKDNNVIVVGNPIENEKIKELIFKKISE